VESGYKIVRPVDREERWLAAQGEFEQDDSARSIRLNGFIQDITERKQLQQKIDRMERLSSLGTLAAGVAHEINQPLQVLKVTADGVVYWHDQGKTADPEKLTNGFRLVSRQVDRISTIVKRLRDFVNRSKSEQVAAVNLNDVAGQALEVFEQRLKSRDISLRRELSNEPPMVWGNSARLEEVFINLVANAMQEMELLEQVKKEIVMTTVCQNETVLLEVYNSGSNIPADVINQIFDPFFTTKINNENMGLGLSIVHSIVTAHEGHISAVNEAEGVRFRLEFPRHRE